MRKNQELCWHFEGINEALTAAYCTNPSKNRDILIEQSGILTVTKPLLITLI